MYYIEEVDEFNLAHHPASNHPDRKAINALLTKGRDNGGQLDLSDTAALRELQIRWELLKEDLYFMEGQLPQEVKK